jgi:hypothetical protein
VHILAEGFTLGLSTGSICLVACAPLLVPYLLAESKSLWLSNLWLLVQFMLGRLMAYLLFAVAVGLASANLEASIPKWVEGAALFLAGGLMLIYAAGQSDFHLGLCRIAAKAIPASRLPFVMGFLVGINVCPPFLAAAARVFVLKDVGLSVLYFLAFFAGTSLYILPLALVTPAARLERLKSIGWLACILSGLWFCCSGLLSFGG